MGKGEPFGGAAGAELCVVAEQAVFTGDQQKIVGGGREADVQRGGSALQGQQLTGMKTFVCFSCSFGSSPFLSLKLREHLLWVCGIFFSFFDVMNYYPGWLNACSSLQTILRVKTRSE